jgi:hypothetical protein
VNYNIQYSYLTRYSEYLEGGNKRKSADAQNKQQNKQEVYFKQSKRKELM